MFGLFVGIGSATFWGFADFLAGLQSRRHPVPKVVIVSQAAGAACLALLALATSGLVLDQSDRVPAMIAGVTSLIAVTAFYSGLAIGTMSVVAPIVATGTAIPVLAGLAAGERPGSLQYAGMLAGIVGVALVAHATRERGGWRAVPELSIVLACAAAISTGLTLTALDSAADSNPVTAVLWVRGISVALLGLALVFATKPQSWTSSRSATATFVSIGLLDTGATTLYAFATTQGLLSVVTPLASMYPVVTVMLARVLLAESLSPMRTAGVVLALVGVLLLALG